MQMQGKVHFMMSNSYIYIHVKGHQDQIENQALYNIFLQNLILM